MPLILPGVLMPWVASGLVAGSAIVVIVLCVCRGSKEKISDHGMPGVVHQIDIDKPLLDKPLQQNLGNSLHLEEGAYDKAKTVTERALPDIPNVLQAGNSITDTDTDHTPDSGSECYATVNKPPDPSATEVRFERVKNGRLPSKRFSQPVENKVLENHMYAQVSKHKGDRRHTTYYSNDSNKAECQPSSSTAAPPSSLPEPEFIGPPLVVHDSFDDNETESLDPGFLTAGQAVAGNVPSAEIPYMTPPALVENVLPQSSLEDIQNPYTTISVREPLERVKKQIVRQQMRQLPNRDPSLEQESVYTEVPDDQTYAEIDSGQTSAESSTTYDQIEPRIQDLPPDPPTVESLKTVAQAHSRQASIASVSSNGSGGNESSSTGRDIAALYSVVDKTGKQRQTIHISENLNAAHHSSEESQKKVEDMYAKVCKKKMPATELSVLESVLSSDSSQVADDVFASPRSSWSPRSTHTRSPPLPPPLPLGHKLQLASLESDDAQRITRRHSADPNYMESNYSGNKPKTGYSTIGQNDSGDSSSYEKIPLDSDDPGYERIGKDFANGDPHYELIGQLQKSDHSSSDPGYEHVPRRPVEKSDSIEPGYEQIRKLDRYDSDAVDPGYERVRRQKRDTENTDPDYDYIPNLSRTDSESGEPGYEKIPSLSRYNSDAADPGYERVKLKKTENSQVSRVSIKMDGSCVLESASSGNENPSCSKDFATGVVGSYPETEKRFFSESDGVDDSPDVITVRECPEKISICINFKPVNEPTSKDCARKVSSEGMNGDAWNNVQKFDQPLKIQVSNSDCSGDGEDRSSCTATQNSTGYETASSGESSSSVGGLKKRRVVSSSTTKEVTVSNSQGSTYRASQQTEKNIWENGQQVYQQANYSVQSDHK